MKHLCACAAVLMVLACAAVWNPQLALGLGAWVTLLDGKTMGDWDRTGDANWRLEDGTVVTDKGRGNLVSKKSYKDFQIRAEFWVQPESNSGIWMRIQDPKKIGGKTGYEVNINDERKTGVEYGTAAIPNVAKVEPGKFLAGNRWNTLDITARGPHIVVLFNGATSVDVKNDMFAQGPIALQGGGGVIKFRKLEIREF